MEIKTKRTRREWSATDTAELIARYPNEPPYILATHFRRTEECIYAKAGVLGLKRAVFVRQPTPAPWMKRYTINESAFNPMNKDTAYVLGFIAADGCLSKRTVIICCRDGDILKKINIVLDSTYPIKDYENQHARRLLISNAAIYDSLCSLGLTPRKSRTLSMPKVPDELFSHFLRGYFDGDGCATYNQTQRALIVRFTSGSEAFLQQLADRIEGAISISRFVVPYKKQNAFWLAYYGPSALKLADFMYADAGSLFLSRKRDKVEQYRNKPPRRQLAPSC